MRNRFSCIPLEWHKRQNKNTGAGLWRGAASLYQLPHYVDGKTCRNGVRILHSATIRMPATPVSHTISGLHRKYSEGADNP
jgi:hypothetical protein